MEEQMSVSSSEAFEWMYNEMLVNAWFNFELIKDANRLERLVYFKTFIIYCHIVSVG